MTDTQILDWLIENAVNSQCAADEIQLVVPNRMISGNHPSFALAIREIIEQQCIIDGADQRKLRHSTGFRLQMAMKEIHAFKRKEVSRSKVLRILTKHGLEAELDSVMAGLTQSK